MYSETMQDDNHDDVPHSIDKASINRLPLAKFEGKVSIIKTAREAKVTVAELMKLNTLGFDTETRPSFRKGKIHNPSLVQFSSYKKAYLFQINLIDTLKPLIPLLTSKKTVKVGIAIRDDIKGLQEIMSFNPGGFTEIADLTSRLDIVNTGLRPLAAILLGLRVSKRAQLSNWAKPVLSPSQIQYAATDAWISLLLFKRGQVLIKELSP